VPSASFHAFFRFSLESRARIAASRCSSRSACRRSYSFLMGVRDRAQQIPNLSE
jgi:hypothetical protein